ncbi:hypothetical protein F4678DRAFT_443319 [Xylaria arbuscula]|nr:hypothetical protein F4678DRAFT_443319 [Xylaria arbuscula]
MPTPQPHAIDSCPRPKMPSNYRSTNAYQWYDQGDPRKLRRRACPAYNTGGQGRVLLTAG